MLARITAAPPPRRPSRAGVDDLAVAHHAGAADDLVVEVERQRAVLADEQLEQRLHVAREQLRGVLGHLAGRFSGEAILTSWRTTVCPGSVSSQLPPASPARSTITEPGFIPSTASAVTSRGAGRPGHERGRDDDVEAFDRLRQGLLLARALLLGQLARVAALAAGLEAEVQPLRAQRSHLLGDLRAHVVAGRAGSQALGGGDRLQARRRRRPAPAPSPAGSCRRRSSASGRSAPAPARRAALRGSRRRCSARTVRPSTGRARCAGSPPSPAPSRGPRRAPDRLRARERGQEADQHRALAEASDRLRVRRGDRDTASLPQIAGRRR